MTGLYVREMLSRGWIRRVLVVPPAGLVGNWERELRTLFRLRFRIAAGADARAGNPFRGPEGDLVVVSLDTLTGERAFGALREEGVAPYDLVVFDEAHKLSVVVHAQGARKRRRYRLAEALAGCADPAARFAGLGWSARHLLLLTATPHMGRDEPYHYLWRLLDPHVFRRRGGVPARLPGGPRSALHPPHERGNGRPRRRAALPAADVRHVQLRPQPRPRRRAGALRRDHRLAAPGLRPRPRRPAGRPSRAGRLPAPARQLHPGCGAVVRAPARQAGADRRRPAHRPRRRGRAAAGPGRGRDRARPDHGRRGPLPHPRPRRPRPRLRGTGALRRTRRRDRGPDCRRLGAGAERGGARRLPAGAGAAGRPPRLARLRPALDPAGRRRPQRRGQGPRRPRRRPGGDQRVEAGRRLGDRCWRGAQVMGVTCAGFPDVGTWLPCTIARRSPAC